MSEDCRVQEASDAALVAAALDGDVSSFGSIVERYWNTAVALALSRIGDPTEAEDIAQESFVKAHSQLYSLRDPSRFAGWFSKIVAQQCTDLLRKKSVKRIISTGETEILEVLACGPATNPGLTGEEIHFVRRAMSELPEKFRQVIVMRFIAGFSTEEIAKQLGKRHGTVRVWLHRAYERLRKDLAPLLEEVETL
jgi:RNA polymerase sigma-70 factor (ECF subfamily)